MADLRTLVSPAKVLQIAKLVVLSLIGVSAAVLVGKHAGSVLSTAAPPYLFLVVHVIIAVIWKLSDRKPPQNPAVPADAPPKDLPEPLSPDSDESCITDDESGEKSPASVASVRVEVEEESGEKDSMDDTWRAIVLKKAGTWERARRPEVEAEAEAAESAGERRIMRKSETFKESSGATGSAAAADDEWNQRFDAFIKKNYDQIRLQTGGGAYRRHVDFENRASHY